MTSTAYEILLALVLSEITEALKAVDETALARLKQTILQANRLFLTGKGRSGLQMRGFAMRLMHMGLTTYMVDDVTTPAIGAGDLLLIGSASGRTSSLLGHAQRAKAQMASVALITAVPQSPLAELAECLVMIPAPTPKAGKGNPTSASNQPMGTLFEQSLGLLCDVLTMQMMDDLGLTSEQMFARHANLE